MASRLKRNIARSWIKRGIFGVAILGFVFIGFLWIGIARDTRTPIRTGVTFSIPYAIELGLNWREVLTATLDDLGVRHFRIPAYWNRIETTRNVYDWSDIDYQMNEIARRNGNVTLAIGAKLPRWPECWMPEWTHTLERSEEEAARLRYLRAAVLRYREHPALDTWQVENEIRFPFGECPKLTRTFFKQEISLVRELDPTHPIATTDSGELSTWLEVGPLVDKLGVSTYRVVTTFGGYVWQYWFIPPYWYARRAMIVSPFVNTVYISEFQMEPWVQSSILETPVEEQFKTFPIEQMYRNIRFMERMQFNEIHLWGVEWWWYMKVAHNDDRFWNAAREFFQRHAPNAL